MSLRIACDLDGTIADMDAALQREAQLLFGADVDLHGTPGEGPKSAGDDAAHVTATAGTESASVRSPQRGVREPGTGITKRPLTSSELRRLWQHVAGAENFWRDLDEIEPGAVAQLAARARAERWEVLFLTQRPPCAGETTQVQSQRWLQAHGFELPSVMVMQGSRGKVADALSLDVLVDDRPENCLDVLTDSKARAVLVWRLEPGLVPAGIARTGIETVFSFAEALARLEQLTVDRGRKRTLAGRLRSAFGGR
jgi:hypothetical protein